MARFDSGLTDEEAAAVAASLNPEVREESPVMRPRRVETTPAPAEKEGQYPPGE